MAVRPRARRLDAGTSTVEMVIVVPILLLLVFGIAEFGIAFGQFQTLSNAAREGARVGVVFRDPADCAANADTEVRTTVTSYAATMIQQAPVVNVSGLCLGPPNAVTVTASVPFNFQVLPNIQGLFGGGGVASINLVGTSTMRNE
jgi:Flp pilus assembly protein TadG